MGRRYVLVVIAASICSGLAVGLTGAPTEPPERFMVLTIDDLPAQRARQMPEKEISRITRMLVEILTTERIPAIGFVNENKLFVDSELAPGRVALLEEWLDAGLELGNHTFSHPDLHQVPLNRFQQDVVRGEVVTRPLAARRQIPYRYFRHPFLHTGLNLDTKHALEGFLSDRGYRVAPVTIDNSEWIFARAYDETLNRGDSELQKRLGEEYVSYMLRMTEYYESQSRELFDREIPQTLLLHANALNADHLTTLIERMRERGYRFVALATALADPAYASPDTYTGSGGITWLHRWALTRGAERSFFDGEPTTAEWVQGIAGIEE